MICKKRKPPRTIEKMMMKLANANFPIINLPLFPSFKLSKFYAEKTN